MKLQSQMVHHQKKHLMLQQLLQRKLLRIWVFLLKTLQQEKKKPSKLTMKLLQMVNHR
tara:strand:+ start:140 stop:313 length:174 start_codon:yes stop_codon:yes gene_type:complete